MLRIASALFVALLIGSVFLLPEAPKDRLAALETCRILGGEAENVEGQAVSMWERVTATPAYSVTGEGQGKLLLGGVRMISSEVEVDDLAAHYELRMAVVRGLRQAAAAAQIELEIVGDEMPAVYGLLFMLEVGADELALSWQMPGEEGSTERFPWLPPSHRSLLPPVLAIALALLLRRPVPALFLGVLAAAFLVRFDGGQGAAASAGLGFLDVFRVFFWGQLVNAMRIQIIVFVVAMLAMVGVVTRNGGIRGIMNAVARIASGVRSTQFATYLMGLTVFFDDYANTILVGGTMRPLTDRFRIAREKLAYIVDSTAAPVAGISIFSTWIAFEVSTFSAQLPLAGLSPQDGYAVFVDTLPFRFYCIFSLVLVAVVTLGGRDFGPMLGAERRARTTGQLVRPGGKPMVSDLATTMVPVPGITIRASRAVIPLVLFIGVTLFEIARTGGALSMGAAELFTREGLTTMLGEASSTWALMIGSMTGLGAAVVLSLAAGMTWEIADAAWRTLRAMVIAIAILYLAWMLAAACEELGTAFYLTVSLGDMEYPMLLPLVLFLLSGAVSFATGSSWGTMGILLPLVVGLSYNLGSQVDIGSTPAGDASGYLLMILSIGAVLEGSIFGDHCSPISDTTVLSSVASASDHIDHVRTQAPYALLCMTVAIAVGYMPCAAFGMSPWVALATGAVVLVVVMRLLGRRAEDPPELDKKLFA